MDLLGIFVLILTIIVGLVVGSFLNVVIYRFPLNMSLAKPGSHCPKCNSPIKWYDNIPVISYIVLKGKCRHCKAHISIRYPLVEILNAVLWFCCFLAFTNYIIPTNDMNWLKFVVSCVICSTMVCIFFCDLDNKEIPELFQGILLICGLLLLLDNPTQFNIMQKVFGFIGAAGLFMIVNLIFRLIKKRDGIGFGDVELVACSGLIIGGYSMIFSLIVSCVVGGIILIILYYVNSKKEKDKEYPFAVLLVPGILLGLFVGQFIVNWYLSVLGVM